MVRSRLGLVLTLGFAISSSSTGCGGGGGSELTKPAPSALAGTWKLTTLNGLPLPYAEGTTVLLRSDSIVIGEGNSYVRYVARSVYQPRQSYDESWTEPGTLAIADSSVNFMRQGSTSVRSGRFTPAAITVGGDGVYVYTKQ